MSDISRLITNLKSAGITISKKLEKAFLKVCIEDFSEYDCASFYQDRPVVFFETPKGGSKTISAPHMIATMVENLELNDGDKVIIYGAKGGYLAAIIAHIIGEDGKIIIVDPNAGIVNHVRQKLMLYPTIQCISIEEFTKTVTETATRILITGQINEVPEWLKEKINLGGFVIAPVGNQINQNLLKIENQDGEYLETDLGSVVFGPVDINDTITDIFSPEELASMIENMIEIVFEMDLVDAEERLEMYDLVAKLRQLPDDLAPPDDFDDALEHPYAKLLVESSDFFSKILPLFASFLGDDIASYSDDYDFSGATNHRDFTP